MIITITLVVIKRVDDTVAHHLGRHESRARGRAAGLIETGCIHEDRLGRMKIRIDGMLGNARRDEGVERLDQIKRAVLERSGAISVVPRDGDDAG